MPHKALDLLQRSRVSLNNSLINRARLPAIDKVWELGLGADLIACSQKTMPGSPLPFFSLTRPELTWEMPSVRDDQLTSTFPGQSGLEGLCNLDLLLLSLTYL